MIRKRLSLVLGLLLLQLVALPVQRASSQGLAVEEARVITLGVTGNDRANAVVFSVDGRHLAVAASAGIHVFDSSTLASEQFVPTGTWVRSLALSQDGTSLAAGLYDETAHLLSFPEMRPIRQFDGLGGWVRSVAFTPDGQLLAAAAGDAVQLWDTAAGSLQLTIPDLSGVRVLAISPDGSILAVGLQDNSIQLRSLSDGSLLKTLLGHEGWVRSLAFSPDGALLASGAFDATARLWDVRTGTLLHTLTDHQSSVLGIAFSPDGSMFATGSVDQTVRLWSSSDGSLLRTFVGHTGFVYTVAFSPDGRLLASGANDNTVRLWDLASPENETLQPPATPSDCRICHHPTKNSSPVAVIDVSCEACHAGGLGVNWCPFFPRSVGDGAKMELVAASHEESGIPVPGRALAVSISAPANGEVVYANSSYVAPLQVNGRVKSSDLPLEQIELRLEVWQAAQLVSSLSGHPNASGQFAFTLGVNPDGYRLRINDPAAPFNCASCHDDYFVQAKLPAGQLRLVVVAAASDGDQATDERWITADVNRTLPLAVTVTDAASDDALVGLTVHASTRLYEWRGRTSSATSREDGQAVIQLEVLSQAPTLYRIEIPSQVVDGVYYSASSAQSLIIDPQAAALSPITLKVASQKGQVSGSLPSVPGAPVTIWAVKLPAGPAFRTQADTDGAFLFTDIPVASYAVFADPGTLLANHLSGPQVIIDLEEFPVGRLELETSPTGGAFTGTISGRDGEWLPFAWLVPSQGRPAPAGIQSGSWSVVDSAAGSWVAVAPGYYSQELGPSSDAAALGLKRRPDSLQVAWGSGAIIIPSETHAQSEASTLEFDSGWVWGQNSVSAPLTIVTDEAAIILSSGQFALERSAGGMAWLYLFDGEAQVTPSASGASFPLLPGQMLALSKSGAFAPLSYNPALLPALRPLASEPPALSWEPGFTAKLQALFMQMGVILAQLVTFITYFIAVISLVLLPWLAVRWISRHPNVPGEENDRK